MFGPKCRLLSDLLSRSTHPKKAQLIGAFNKLRGNNKRSVIAHGYIWSDPTRVRFIERIATGDFRVKTHEFTYQTFLEHVKQFIDAGTEFFHALGVSEDELGVFADAAFNLDRKSRTSPDKPDATAS